MVTLIRHPKAKHLKLRVTACGEVKVTAPLRATKKEIEAFIVASQGWIESRQKLLLEHTRKIEDELAGYHGRVLVDGEWVEAMLNPSQRSLAVWKEGVLHLKSSKALEHFYRKKALEQSVALVASFSSLMGVDVAKVQVNFAKTRWGSCSSRGVITLNAHLAKAPPFVFEYVVVHELAHRVHMNHSKAFWNLVGSYNTSHEKAKEWLNEFHTILTADLSKNLVILQ